MILSRFKSQQGRGWYKISQKVTFLETTRFSKSFQFDETLWKGPNSSFLEVQSLDFPALKARFSYQKSSKKWRDEGTKQNFQTNLFIESYFSSWVPSWLSSVSSLDLGRALGVVNYVFKIKNKTVWIEQDEFVIRQIQIENSENEKFVLKAQNYQMFSRGMFFPRIREFISEDYKVKFEITQIEPLSKRADKSLIENQWKLSNLNQNVDSVRNFYQKFR